MPTTEIDKLSPSAVNYFCDRNRETLLGVKFNKSKVILKKLFYKTNGIKCLHK